MVSRPQQRKMPQKRARDQEGFRAHIPEKGNIKFLFVRLFVQNFINLYKPMSFEVVSNPKLQFNWVT